MCVCVVSKRTTMFVLKLKRSDHKLSCSLLETTEPVFTRNAERKKRVVEEEEKDRGGRKEGKTRRRER